MSISDEVLALLYERGEDGITAQECALALGKPYPSVRCALWRLSKEGWTTATLEPTGRRGGPFKRWRVRQASACV